ncbi:hypothetical protein QUB63_16995 [Microcoleus sp. ARI1-B5]|uniref:hypothetical protein n=1 Tax=unclassified Microcoleus TaxID=2642155 RepID=UPI002FD0626F
MSVGDESLWKSVFGQDYYRESIGYQQVEPIYLPGSFASQTLRVRVSSATARNTWRAAGELVQILGQVSGWDFEGETKYLPLNAAKLISFSEFAGYQLKFYPKYWIDSFQIQIDKYLL